MARPLGSSAQIKSVDLVIIDECDKPSFVLSLSQSLEADNINAESDIKSELFGSTRNEIYEEEVSRGVNLCWKNIIDQII